MGDFVILEVSTYYKSDYIKTKTLNLTSNIMYRLEIKSSYVMANVPRLKYQKILPNPINNKKSKPCSYQGSHKRKVSAMSLFGMGLPEIAIIAGVAALVFGPSKLPELGKTLGVSVKSFQSAAKEFEKELKSGI